MFQIHLKLLITYRLIYNTYIKRNFNSVKFSQFIIFLTPMKEKKALNRNENELQTRFYTKIKNSYAKYYMKNTHGIWNDLTIKRFSSKSVPQRVSGGDPLPSWPLPLPGSLVKDLLCLSLKRIKS